MRFFDKKENRGIVISIFVLFILSFFYYTYFDDDITLRTVIVYAAAGTISLLTAQSLFLNKTRSITASAYLNTALFLAQGCYFAFRALVTLTVAPVNGFFSPTTIQTGSFLFLFVQGILLTFCLIIMVNQRLNAGMTEANELLQVDITKRKQAEEALEEERRRLQQALDEVKTLRGIVPICSYCKKIRDDTGYWNQVEKYVSDHSDAKFSHGICPACFEKEMKEIKS
jgi:PAS domain-containing protein